MLQLLRLPPGSSSAWSGLLRAVAVVSLLLAASWCCYRWHLADRKQQPAQAHGSKSLPSGASFLPPVRARPLALVCCIALLVVAIMPVAEAARAASHDDRAAASRSRSRSPWLDIDLDRDSQHKTEQSKKYDDWIRAGDSSSRSLSKEDKRAVWNSEMQKLGSRVLAESLNTAVNLLFRLWG